jgi:hypothetical protein
MKSIRILIGVIATLGLAACATTSSNRYAGQVVSSEIGAMARCHYLGSISGASGLSGFFAIKGADNVKQDLLRRADVMGATHVVWERPDVDYEGTSVTAKAYRCDTP